MVQHSSRIEYVPTIYLHAARSLGVSRLREFFVIVIPADAPHTFAGIRLGGALAFLSLVAAELSGASSGINYRLNKARQYISTDRMFTLLIELWIRVARINAPIHRTGRRPVPGAIGAERYQPCTFSAIIWPSGCGKSTSLNAIADFIARTSGQIRIDGRVLNDQDEKVELYFSNMRCSSG